MTARLLALLLLLFSSYALALTAGSSRRLTPTELTQLADVLFQNNQEFRTLTFRYVIAWIEDEGPPHEEILVVHEHPRLNPDHDMEVYRFRRGPCMSFKFNNYAQVVYGTGRPDVTELGWGGLMMEHIYWDAIRHIRRTPVIQVERNSTPRTCAKFVPMGQ